MSVLRLKPGRERPLQRKHPWIFSGAVQSIDGQPGSGEIVEVLSSAGDWLGYAAYSPSSQIRGRVISWDSNVPVDSDLIHTRILQAIEHRHQWLKAARSNAVREVFSESDGLPGLIVDRYDEVRVVQLHTAWADSVRDVILDTLVQTGDVSLVYERSDADVRKLEGLDLRAGVMWGESKDSPVEITEGALRFAVDIQSGHKTGFYLDQKENRLWLGSTSLTGEVLDAFAYTGAFSMVCLAAGAEHVTAIDSSHPALQRAAEHARLNGFDPDRLDTIEDDVFHALRNLRDRMASFNLIVLDPPKFAATTAQVGRASRAYKDINLLALKLLKPGGLLCTFSCSGGVSGELFQKIVADAALDAGVQASIVHHFHQASDHPVPLAFPESEYLKGFLVRVT
ncbi:MAG: class I SAM-dependent rRNA methyltransferase [Anaerolineales bacterium]